MTFQSPAMLAGLLLPAVAVAAYFAFQRLRRRYSVRFTNLDLLGAVVPRRSRWRRHVPPSLALAAAVLLVIAVARPQVWADVKREGAQVVLVTDTSGSMQARDVAPDPAALREIARVSGGRFVGARDSERLVAAYERLGAEVGSKRERRELTAAFAGAALLLLLSLGVGSSLVWFGRFP